MMRLKSRLIISYLNTSALKCQIVNGLQPYHTLIHKDLISLFKQKLKKRDKELILLQNLGTSIKTEL